MQPRSIKICQKGRLFKLKKIKKSEKGISKTKIRFLPNEFVEFETCSSKKKFIQLMKNFPSKYKRVLQTYITDFLFQDIYSRKLKHRTRLLCKKHFFYRSISEPLLMENNKGILNAEVKQFCSVSVRFISKHFNHIERVTRQKLKN